jgi:glutamyl-tRNA synthetase
MAKLFRVLLEESLDPILDWNGGSVEAAMRAHCERHELKAKELFMPVRVAVTGRTATPGLFDTMAVLGKELCRRRLRCAVDVLGTMKA